jgi:DNA-3-methyladenine glycosylase I
MSEVAVRVGGDGLARCAWAGVAADYCAYHDTEWGFPVADDVRLFEKLSLEGFQAGLSWLTILRKRDAFRRAFAVFSFEVLAGWGPHDVERLLRDTGIVRHRGKIEAVLNNARCAVDLRDEAGSLAGFAWRYEGSADGAAMARELKRRGWRFVGPTTVYSFMQAMGLVNDHATGCVVRERVERARAAFAPPAPPTTA